MMRHRALFRWLVTLALSLLVSILTAQDIKPVTAVDRTDPGADRLAARGELGRLLFWDPILSGDRDIACATCHHPDFAYADGRDRSLGTGSIGLGQKRVDTSGGQIPALRRNAPTVLNTAFNGHDGRRRRRNGEVRPAPDPAMAPMFWDNRVRGLEAQALEPIKTFEEMRGKALTEESAIATVVSRLQRVPEYVRRFGEAFDAGSTIDSVMVAQAIAAFERTLLAMNSPFDRFRAGDDRALTPQQRRGMVTFDQVGCDRCHDGPMFSDFDLHAEGVPEHPGLSTADAGDGRFRFRTPSLRNIALTAPYMHNGTLATLADVLRFYDNGRSENPKVSNESGRRGRTAERGPRLDRDFVRVDDMSDEQMADIVAFLESLTDANFDKRIPDVVPSGFPPGGRIARR